MKGFNKKYKNFPDYILKITKQIWEGKDVESIGEFYTKNIPVRSPFGITYGNKPVIEATYNTLKEFPNRQLMGEDVIWNGNDNNGYHSSHRILSKGTHLGDGFYGKPTGKDIYYRVIADCACKDNQVYDEWIVRDQGAMVRQIGYTPKEFAQIMIDKEGGLEKAKKGFIENLTFNKPTVLFSQKGNWKIKIEDKEFNIYSKDTFSIPLDKKITISVDNNEDCFLNCVSKA